MNNPLLTSSLANLFFAFSFKLIILLNQSLSKCSFFPVVLAAASLFVCYLQGTAALAQLLPAAGASSHSCGKELPLPNTGIPKLALRELRYFF